MGVIIKATGISTDINLHDSIRHAIVAGEAYIYQRKISASFLMSEFTAMTTSSNPPMPL
jgi:hypothetical protein